MSPLARIVVRTPRLELRLPTRAEVRELAAVARGGIHDPSVMPFGVPWTDRCGEPGFDDSFAAYHEAQQASWRPDAWRLELAVFHEGGPIGVQTLRADRFAVERVVATGSWLGRPWQGRGFGTEMRTAVLALAFEGLGAEAARSGAMIDNQASLGVSRKLGYAVVGTSTVAPRGAPVEHPDLELRREAFAPAVDVRIEGLERALPLFGAS
jgi:RimJ/RimL family protein N-acetyltransferase